MPLIRGAATERKILPADAGRSFKNILTEVSGPEISVGFSQAAEIRCRHNDMIEKRHAQELTCFNQSLGRFEVLAAGIDRACRVIMSDDQRVRIRDDRGFENLSWMNQTGADSPMRYKLEASYVVLRIEVKSNKMLF